MQSEATLYKLVDVWFGLLCVNSTTGSQLAILDFDYSFGRMWINMYHEVLQSFISW